MKILREVSRVYKGKKYYKYKINFPEDILSKAHLKEGDSLIVEVKKYGLILKKKI